MRLLSMPLSFLPHGVIKLTRSRSRHNALMKSATTFNRFRHFGESFLLTQIFTIVLSNDVGTRIGRRNQAFYMRPSISVFAFKEKETM